MSNQCKYVPSPNITVGIEKSFDSALLDLSVRDIVNALDGIENQYIDTITKSRWGEDFSTAQPIVKFMAFLKRLNAIIDTTCVLKQLIREPIVLNMMGGFLLNIPGMQPGLPLEFNFVPYVLKIINNEIFAESISTSYCINQPVKIQQYLNKVLEEAKNYVV